MGRDVCAAKKKKEKHSLEPSSLPLWNSQWGVALQSADSPRKNKSMFVSQCLCMNTLPCLAKFVRRRGFQQQGWVHLLQLRLMVARSRGDEQLSPAIESYRLQGIKGPVDCQLQEQNIFYQGGGLSDGGRESTLLPSPTYCFSDNSLSVGWSCWDNNVLHVSMPL